VARPATASIRRSKSWYPNRGCGAPRSPREGLLKRRPGAASPMPRREGRTAWRSPRAASAAARGCMVMSHAQFRAVAALPTIGMRSGAIHRQQDWRHLSSRGTRRCEPPGEGDGTSSGAAAGAPAGRSERLRVDRPATVTTTGGSLKFGRRFSARTLVQKERTRAQASTNSRNDSVPGRWSLSERSGAGACFAIGEMRELDQR